VPAHCAIRLGDTEGLIFALYGRRAHMMIAGEARASLHVAEQCLTTAERYTERDYRLLGHYGLGATWMLVGELVNARAQFERTVALYNPDRDRDLTARCAADPLASALGYLSLIYWALGYPEQARLSSATAFRCSNQPKHAATSAHVHVYAGAQLAELFRDTMATRDYASAVIAMSDEHGLKAFHAHATILLGWALGRSML
jgi:predicted ATPase